MPKFSVYHVYSFMYDSGPLAQSRPPMSERAAGLIAVGLEGRSYWMSEGGRKGAAWPLKACASEAQIERIVWLLQEVDEVTPLSRVPSDRQRPPPFRSPA